jgi:hypothetical protein
MTKTMSPLDVIIIDDTASEPDIISLHDTDSSPSVSMLDLPEISLS